MKRVAIIGAGDVGAHIAYSAILNNLTAEFSLVDIDQYRTEGQVLDLRDSISYSRAGSIKHAQYGDEILSETDIFVITAGRAQEPGEKRTDLLRKNTKILTSIRDQLGKIREDAVILLVTNPVDALTEIATRIFGLQRGQVFGTGTILDTSRMRWHIAEKYGLHPQDISGFVFGEHGDSQFIAWSGVNIAGMKIIDDLPQEDCDAIEVQTLGEAYEIINRKGSTYYGIGATTARILAAVINDWKIILPVSAHLEGEFGLSEVSIGVPAVIGKQGVERIWETDLTKKEMKQLHGSAHKIKSYLEEAGEE